MNWLRKWFGKVEDFASDVLENDLLEQAVEMKDKAEELIRKTEIEKAQLRDQIDALTRKISENDRLIEEARERAARAAELAAKVNDYFREDHA